MCILKVNYIEGDVLDLSKRQPLVFTNACTEEDLMPLDLSKPKMQKSLVSEEEETEIFIRDLIETFNHTDEPQQHPHNNLSFNAALDMPDLACFQTELLTQGNFFISMAFVTKHELER